MVIIYASNQRGYCNMNSFHEGVKPGGLTTSAEIRILLCYIIDSAATPVSLQQLQASLLGQDLVNYFALADSLAQLKEQGHISGGNKGYSITDSGHTIAETLAHDVPKSVRDTAINAVITAQQHAAKAASNHSELIKADNGGYWVNCSINDADDSLFKMDLFMPSELSAEAASDYFTSRGDVVYKMVLSCLTGNKELLQNALEEFEAAK